MSDSRKALDSGHPRVVIDALEEISAAEVNGKNSRGQTRLHLAVLRGNDEQVSTLIKGGSSVSKTDNHGMTPLHYCAQHIHKSHSMVEKLVKAGASARERDQFGRTAFALLCIAPTKDAFRYLLEICPSVPQAPDVNGWRPFNFASAGGGRGLLSLDAPLTFSKEEDVEEVKNRMKAALIKAELGKLMDKSSKIESQQTAAKALHLACGLDNLEVVQWLVLVMGVDVNGNDDNGWTPLLISSTLSRPSIASFLLHIAGSDINARGPRGLSALHIAVSAGTMETVLEILTFQKDVDALDDFQRSPLHYAAAQNRSDIAAVLIKAGADLTLKDARGWTPNQLLPKSFWQTWCTIL